MIEEEQKKTVLTKLIFCAHYKVAKANKQTQQLESIGGGMFDALNAL